MEDNIEDNYKYCLAHIETQPIDEDQRMLLANEMDEIRISKGLPSIQIALPTHTVTYWIAKLERVQENGVS